MLTLQRLLAGWGALGLLAGCGQRPSPAPPSSGANSLIGAWQSTVQFSGGVFASIKDLRFLYVFNPGGTLTESSNYDGVPPVPPAYGVWREVAPNRFEAKYIFYITKPPASFQDIAGGGGWLPTGHGVLLERIQLAADGQAYESTISFSAFDLAGKPAPGGGEAQAHGTRIAF
jgi:hypothetical protein